MAVLEARPTEYRGVRFRSKSEAMFALWLDLRSEEHQNIEEFCRRQSPQNYLVNGGVSSWRYEPKELFGFNCDFVVCSVLFSESAIAPFLYYEFIEYKPALPTQTYVKNYFEKYIKAMEDCENTQLTEVSRRSTAMIYHGSVYQNNRGMFYCDQFGNVEGDNEDWLVNQEDSLREYRFDLEVQRG